MFLDLVGQSHQAKMVLFNSEFRFYFICIFNPYDGSLKIPIVQLKIQVIRIVVQTVSGFVAGGMDQFGEKVLDHGRLAPVQDRKITAFLTQGIQSFANDRGQVSVIQRFFHVVECAKAYRLFGVFKLVKSTD